MNLILLESQTLSLKVLKRVMSIGIAQAGLQEMTPDIRKLVNLKVLNLCQNTVLHCIPESISCLRDLQTLYIAGSPITKLPVGLATLANLRSLTIKNNFLILEPLQFPSCLKVRDLLCRSLVCVYC
jgi:Leucine-rich repeat (LRR) protein